MPAPKSAFISMAEHDTAHHEKEIHGKIAAGCRNRRERLLHMEYHHADGGDTAQRVERVKDAPFRHARRSHHLPVQH
jgi:hypothetical protein